MTNAAVWRSFEKARRGRPLDGAGSLRSGYARGGGPVVARDPRDTADRAERGGGIRRFHLAAARRRQRLPAVSACAACRQPAAVELRPGRQRPVDSARRNSPDRRFRQDPGVWRKPEAPRVPTIVNGLVDFGCAALLWHLSRTIGAERAIGIVVGAYIAAAGWRMLMAPVEATTPAAAAGALRAHPDHELGLPSNETFARLRAEADAASQTVRATDLMWMTTLAVVFLAIHAGRMPISDSLLGISSPFVATAGDVLMTVALATLLILPARLLWRRLTRPVERVAWSLRLGAKAGTAPMNRAADWLVGRWLESRFGFAMRLREGRTSLAAALILVLRLGLPVTAFFVAFNPIWGFTWYFNTESWATGVYQKMTQLRVDPWRFKMIDAVTRVYGGDGDGLFRVDPRGLQGGGDFSFLVIGDPGEGDASQYSLVSRYLELGRRDDVKFLVVSSDVIYPAGSMPDYRVNLYLPFQGFAKPIYAIPGNHDWYDALEGFNANFLEPKAARAAIEARVEADLGLTSTNARRIDKLMAEAARLRRQYGVDVGTQ